MALFSCRSCNTGLTQGAKACHRCGLVVVRIPPKVRPPTRRCPTCGFMLGRQEVICTTCWEPPTTARETPRKKDAQHITKLTVAVVVIAIFIPASILLYLVASPPTPTTHKRMATVTKPIDVISIAEKPVSPVQEEESQRRKVSQHERSEEAYKAIVSYTNSVAQTPEAKRVYLNAVKVLRRIHVMYVGGQMSREGFRQLSIELYGIPEYDLVLAVAAQLASIGPDYRPPHDKGDDSDVTIGEAWTAFLRLGDELAAKKK